MQDRKAHGRPFTARSVILSTLLGTRPPRLPTRLLVNACELFGISEGTARVALSRMVGAGEVVADGGHHQLAGRLLERQAHITESRAARTGAWPGRRWITAVVTAERRSAADRAELRALMRTQRLAELREGVWLRPDNLGTEPFATDVCAWLRSVPDGEPVALARALWNLDAWADQAVAYRAQLEPLHARLAAGHTDALAPGFVLSAAVLRHFEADPLLPAALLPSGWPGDDLRRRYDRFDTTYRDALRTWFAAHT